MSNESEQFNQLRKFFYVSENIIPDQGAKKALVDATGNASDEIQVIQNLIDVPDTVKKSIELLKNLVPNNDPGKKQDKDNSGDFKKYFAITNQRFKQLNEDNCPKVISILLEERILQKDM